MTSISRALFERLPPHWGRGGRSRGVRNSNLGRPHMKKLLITTAIVGVTAVLSLMTIYSSVPTNAQSARCPCFTELVVVGSGKSASESKCVFTKILTKQLGHVGVLLFCSPQNRQLMFTITPQDCKGFAGNLPAELFRNVDETIDMSDLEGGRGALMAAAETLDCRGMPE